MKDTDLATKNSGLISDSFIGIFRCNDRDISESGNTSFHFAVSDSPDDLAINQKWSAGSSGRPEGDANLKLGLSPEYTGRINPGEDYVVQIVPKSVYNASGNGQGIGDVMR